MSGEGMIAAARAGQLVEEALPPPQERNPFYENAARRIGLVLPELTLSPGILAVIDLALHEERQAARRAWGFDGSARR